MQYFQHRGPVVLFKTFKETKNLVAVSIQSFYLKRLYIPYLHFNNLSQWLVLS